MIFFDIGCGNGEYTLIASQYVKEVLGIDLSESLISDAREKCNDNTILNTNFIVHNINNGIPNLPSSPCGVSIQGVFACIMEDSIVKSILTNIASIIKPHGYLILRDSIALNSSFVEHHVSGYVSFYRNRAHFTSLLKESGFKQLNTIPLFNNSLTENELSVWGLSVINKSYKEVR